MDIRDKDNQLTTCVAMAPNVSYFKRPLFKYIEAKEDAIVNVDQVRCTDAKILASGIEYVQVSFGGDKERQIGSMVVKSDKVQWKNAYGRAVFAMHFIELKCTLVTIARLCE